MGVTEPKSRPYYTPPTPRLTPGGEGASPDPNSKPKS